MTQRASGCAACALERRDSRAGCELHAVLAVQRGEEGAQLGAERQLEWIAERLDQRHVEAALPAARRHFRADETAADDGDARTPRQSRTDRQRVVERAQHEDAVERRLVRQPPRRRSGRDDEPVERDGLAVRELHAPPRRVERRGAHAEMQFGAERVEPATRQRDALRLPLAAQDLLRQRRPIVRRVRLGADPDQPAVEAALAQRLDGAQPRERSADDGDRAQRARHAHPSSASTSATNDGSVRCGRGGDAGGSGRPSRSIHTACSPTCSAPSTSHA